MAHPAFVDIADTDIDLDSPLTVDVFEDFRQCDRAVRIALIGFHVAETTFTSATYVTLATLYFWCPDVADFSGIQRRISFEFEGKVTSGTATFKTTVAGTDSSEPTQTSTSYGSKTCVQNIAGALKGTLITMTVSGKMSGGGTGYLKCVDRLTALLEY